MISSHCFIYWRIMTHVRMSSVHTIASIVTHSTAHLVISEPLTAAPHASPRSRLTNGRPLRRQVHPGRLSMNMLVYSEPDPFVNAMHFSPVTAFTPRPLSSHLHPGPLLNLPSDPQLGPGRRPPRHTIPLN